MSYIASIIAPGEGAAIIADSLETPNLPYQEVSGEEECAAEPYWDEEAERAYCDNYCEERLCQEDHLEKIFRFDQFTAIATSIPTYINGRSMQDLIEEFKTEQADQQYRMNDFIIMTGLFCSFLDKQIRAHLDRYLAMSGGVVILTRYDIPTGGTHICKIRIRESFHRSLRRSQNLLLVKNRIAGIVCGGYCPISKSILNACGRTYQRNLPCMVRHAIRRIRSPDPRIPEAFAKLITNDPYYRYLFASDLEIVKISELNMRQAINLASLLMRLETDFQSLTTGSPKVGGVVRLAIIDEQGFRFVM